MIKFNRKTLHDVLVVINQIIVARPVVPVLANVKVIASDGLAKFQASNLDKDIRISCECDGDGEFLINHKLFYGLVSGLKDESLTLDVSPEAVVIKHEKGKARIPTSSEQFPEISEYELNPKITVTRTRIIESLKLSGFVAEQADSFQRNTWIGNVKLTAKDGRMQLLSANGAQMSLTDTKAEGEGELLLPAFQVRSLVGILTTAEAESISFLDNPNRVFVFIGTAVYSFTKNVHQFPNLNVLIDAKPSYSFLLMPEDIKETLTRIKTFAEERTYAHKWELTKTQLTLSSKSGNGSLTESFDIDLEGEPLEVGFNFQHCLDIFSRVGGECEISLAAHKRKDAQGNEQVSHALCVEMAGDVAVRMWTSSMNF